MRSLDFYQRLIGAPRQMIIVSLISRIVVVILPNSEEYLLSSPLLILLFQHIDSSPWFSNTFFLGFTSIGIKILRWCYTTLIYVTCTHWSNTSLFLSMFGDSKFVYQLRQSGSKTLKLIECCANGSPIMCLWGVYFVKEYSFSIIYLVGFMPFAENLTPKNSKIQVFAIYILLQEIWILFSCRFSHYLIDVNTVVFWNAT